MHFVFDTVFVRDSLEIYRYKVQLHGEMYTYMVQSISGRVRSCCDRWAVLFIAPPTQHLWDISTLLFVYIIRSQSQMSFLLLGELGQS